MPAATKKPVNSPNGIGYITGYGGTVTQATNKSTSVTLDKVCGTVTTHNAALAGDTSVQFTLTNSKIAAGDLIIINYTGAATPSSYNITGTCSAGAATINIRNVTTGSLSEAIVISFAIFKATTS